jgi:hypothetical protein
MVFRSLLITVLLSFQLINISAQNPLRLQAEVDHLDSLNHKFDNEKEIILFTGSSSIRKWDNIDEYFPDHQVINTGFGGSQMRDLLFFADRLILKYMPNKVLIYEGDNDIAWGKSVIEIMLSTDSLIRKLKSNNPDIEIILISAKPSPARWELKDSYLALNNAFKNYCNTNSNVYYADVWDVMLDKNGKPISELFVADSLHMSTSGYDLWADELIKYLD